MRQTPIPFKTTAKKRKKKKSARTTLVKVYKKRTKTNRPKENIKVSRTAWTEKPACSITTAKTTTKNEMEVAAKPS